MSLQIIEQSAIKGIEAAYGDVQEELSCLQCTNSYSEYYKIYESYAITGGLLRI